MRATIHQADGTVVIRLMAGESVPFKAYADGCKVNEAMHTFAAVRCGGSGPGTAFVEMALEVSKSGHEVLAALQAYLPTLGYAL